MACEPNAWKLGYDLVSLSLGALQRALRSLNAANYGARRRPTVLARALVALRPIEVAPSL
jgi:hypothetical protein